MTLLPSLFVLLEAQPPPTHFVQRRNPPGSELPASALSHLTTICTQPYPFFSRHGGPLGRLAAQVHNPERNTFRIPPKPRAHEPWAAASFNPGM